MAQFPYLLQCGFENGIGTDDDLAETDGQSAGAVIHYIDLVRRHGIVPWRGAYAYLIDESICTVNECKLVSAGCNVTAANYWAMGFAFYAKSTTMANGNRTSLVKLLNGATEEVCLQLYYTDAGGLQLLLTEAQNTAVGTNPVTPLAENKWHWIELHGANDLGANNGTATLVLDGESSTALGSLDQLAITDLQIGVDDQDAGHTAGIYVFDDIIFAGINTAAVRIGLRSQFPENPHISAIASKSYNDCVFLGPGTVDEVSLLTNNVASTGDIIRLYDTDTSYTTGDYSSTFITEVNSLEGVQVSTGPFRFERGCLARITAEGANGARGIVKIATAPEDGYPAPVYYGNQANLKRWALRDRIRRPGNS